MSGGLLGGLVMSIAAAGIAALRNRYPKVMTIVVRGILGLIFFILIGAVIVVLINPKILDQI